MCILHLILVVLYICGLVLTEGHYVKKLLGLKGRVCLRQQQFTLV